MARLVITLATFVVLFYFVSVGELIEAARRIPIGALGLCMLALCAGQFASVLRFQLLFDAFGATRKLPLRESLRLFMIASFYNTYLPGAIAGDLARAVAIRPCFGGALTRALAVGFVERITGFSGMLLLTSAVAIVRPIPGIRGLVPFSLLGFAATLLAVGAVALGHRLARVLPGKLGELAANLPELRSPTAFSLVVLCAVVTHVCAALGFHAIISSLTTNASLAESLVIVPLACAAMYVPATIAGAGTRDAAFVLLYGGVGVAAADALAMSLTALLCTLVISGLCGIANFMRPHPH